MKIEDYLNSNKKYVDPDFPAEEKSIGPEKIPEKIEWKRPE